MWQGLSTSRFQLLLLCICYWHGPKHLISFSSYKAWKPPRFVSSQSRTNINLEGVSKKNPTTPNQISYSFKWIFSPELKLFLNPIFSALNIPCLIAGEKNLPSYLQIKLLPLYLHRPLNCSYVLQTAQGTDCTRNCYIWITSSNISSSLQTAISLPSFMLLIPW